MTWGDVLTGCLLALMVWCLWGIISNEVTYRQRKAVIDGLFRSPSWKQLLHQFEQISYKQHHWRLLTFRRPHVLYPPVLRQFLRDAK